MGSKEGLFFFNRRNTKLFLNADGNDLIKGEKCVVFRA